MSRIYVNREYEQAFRSICQLIQGGSLNGLGWSVDNGVIKDGVYEYQLTDVFTDEKEQIRHGFEKDGATWFKPLRGEYVQNNDAIWTSFIETVGMEYHKRYSVLEYQQQPKTKEKKAIDFEYNKNLVDNFCKSFYPEFFQNTEVVEVEGEDTKEDIYGVSLRIELSGGTGASLPVLCKVYFSKSGKIMEPIQGFVAQGIDANLAEIIPEDSENNQTISEDGIIDTTLTAMDNLINNRNINFADYICYSGESDDKAVQKLLSQLSHDDIELECQRVDVLYITHIKTSISLYDVKYNGRPLFRVRNDLNRALTLYCANCGSHEKLIDVNHISYRVGEEEITVILQPELEDFGLTPEQIVEIKEYSKFKNHFLHISCFLEGRCQECNAIKCISQLFDADSSEAVLYKCKNCPYPEVVYTTLSGEKKYTPALRFTKDTMGLVDIKDPNVEIEKCSCCGRYFSKSVIKMGLCPTCLKSEDDQDEEKKALYKKYKSLLPLSVRLLSIFAKKFCVEDEELIIFVIGKKKYAFNKLCVKEKGYFDKPSRMY